MGHKPLRMPEKSNKQTWSAAQLCEHELALNALYAKANGWRPPEYATVVPPRWQDLDERITQAGACGVTGGGRPASTTDALEKDVHAFIH